MGGRKSYSYSEVLGGGSRVKQGLDDVQIKIDGGDLSNAIGSAIKVIAISDPGIRNIIFSLKLGKIGFDIYAKAEAESRITGDYESALAKAIIKVVGQELTGSGEPLVNAGVKICWGAIKSAAGIEESHTVIDELVVNTITNVLMDHKPTNEVDITSFLTDTCSTAIDMLFETEIKSKEYEGTFLGKSYQEQKYIEKIFKDASSDVAKVMVNRLIDEGFLTSTVSDMVLKAILEQALNDSIDKITSS